MGLGDHARRILVSSGGTVMNGAETGGGLLVE